MKNERWYLICFTAVLILVVMAVSLLHRKNSRVFRLVQKAFWSFSLLLLSEALGGVGANAANTLTVCLLGLPGYAALTALSFL